MEESKKKTLKKVLKIVDLVLTVAVIVSMFFIHWIAGVATLVMTVCGFIKGAQSAVAKKTEELYKAIYQALPEFKSAGTVTIENELLGENGKIILTFKED